MKTTFALACLALTCCAASAFGQAAPNPLTDAIMARYHTIRQNLVEAAQVMPEEHYEFRLTPAQRPFGEWIGHVAMGNMFYCATIKGEAAPDTAHIHQLTSKADLVAAIQKSFDYCDEALKGMTDQKALAEATVAGKKVYPVQGMIGVVASGNEHYGNLVGYLRSKGITPPSSAAQKIVAAQCRPKPETSGNWVKIRDMIKNIEKDGWTLHRTRGSHRQFKHPFKPGRVTIPGQPKDDLSPGMLSSILKQAGLTRQDLK